jgi:hypothetical protein
VTVQDEFEVTAKEVDPADAGTFWLGGVTMSVGVAPSCVTVTITAGIPLTVTVMLATLPLKSTFSA